MDIKTHELLPTQEKYINLDHPYELDVAMYQGGFGSGKTYAGSLLGIMLCIAYPGIKGLVVAETFPLLDRTTKEKWFEHLDNAGFRRYVHWNYNETKSILTFKNGSQVIFSHCAEPEKLRSLEVGFIEIEEASTIQESTFKELLGRLRQTQLRGGKLLPRRRLFGHTNPEASKGWIWTHFVEKSRSTIEYNDIEEPFEVRGRSGKTRYIKKLVEEEVEGEKVKIMYRLVIAPTVQNFHNPASYVAGMKSSFDPEFYRINVLGEFGDYTSGLVTKGFERDKQLIPLVYNPTSPLHLSCDFNVDPNCWFVLQIIDDNIYFLDEIILEHTNTEECMKEFMRRYPSPAYPHIVVNGDASGGAKNTAAIRGNNYAIMLNMLRSGGYQVAPYAHIPNKNPDKIDRINAWNAKMCNANGEHAMFFNAYIDEDGMYQPLTPRLIHAIENLKFAPGTNVIQEPSRVDLRKDPNVKFDVHVFDGASYPASYYFPIRQEVNPRKEIGRPRLLDSRFNLVGDDF